MGMLIALLAIALGALVLGIVGGVIAGRTQLLIPLFGTIASYYLFVGVPSALLIMVPGGEWLRSFAESFIALARSLLILGLVPLLIAFAVSAWIARSVQGGR